MTVHLYVQIPKGMFPEDDTGLIMGSTEASADISFEAMLKLQTQALDIVLSDPAVAARRLVDRRLRAAAAAAQPGRMFINLKPLDQRGGLPTNQVINRMRDKLQGINGLEVRMFASRDIRVGARQGNSQYQYTLWDPDIDELNEWAPKVLERMKQIPGIVDVSSDRQAGGLQLDVKIDRDAAARLGVRIADIDSALNNAFSQRQVSTIYAQRNQYRVILEVDPRLQRDPSDLKNIYVPSIGGGPQVPLTAVIRVDGEHRAAGRQPSGAVPGRDASATIWRRATRSIRRCATSIAAMAEIHTPGRPARRDGGRRARLRRAGLAAAAADPRRADRRLHRAGRALRKPGASADHHLDAALGRARRAAGAATSPAWSCR